MLKTIDQAYDQETLHRLQQVEVEIFKEFSRICDKYDLQYFGFAGTGIGAVRHKGIIPWDDDIDVGMLRKDYNKFLEVAKKELGSEYKIVNAYECEQYPLPTTRMIKTGTKFRDYSLKNVDCDLGIFLDIFSFENIPRDPVAREKHSKRTWFWNKMCILRATSNPTLGFRGWKRKVIHAACMVIHGVLALFHISRKWLFSKLEKEMRRYEHDSDVVEVGYLCDTKLFSNMIMLEDLFPLVELDFEDTKMKFPKNLDKMLKHVYGDYMTPPPEDKRCNHVPYELDFGD